MSVLKHQEKVLEHYRTQVNLICPLALSLEERAVHLRPLTLVRCHLRKEIRVWGQGDVHLRAKGQG